MYIRNDNMTRLLSGDLQSDELEVMTSVDLKAGPVGIVIPLAGIYIYIYTVF